MLLLFLVITLAPQVRLLFLSGVTTTLREIAGYCGVSYMTVSRVKEELSQSDTSQQGDGPDDTTDLQDEIRERVSNFDSDSPQTLCRNQHSSCTHSGHVNPLSMERPVG